MYSLQPFPNEAVHAAATLHFNETSITLQAARWPDQDHQGLRHPARRSGCQTSRLVVRLGSLHEHVVLGSNDTWISRSTDKDPGSSPVPSNTTFIVPGPRNAGPNDLLPQLSVKLALTLSSSALPNPKNETLTHEFIILGCQDHRPTIYALPAHWQLREHNGFPWDGRLDSGSYFVVRALRVNGDETKKEDWDVNTSPAVSIKYL
ncbi:hypothetical protein E4U12_003064 [Claviceps purpurea]|nr:hypothetical protein E4U12_003064 [Claviceps purpurea]